MKLILASQSPRRQVLLRRAGFDLEVCPAHFEEKSGRAIAAAEVVSYNARGKCLEVVALHGDSCLVLGADTVVVLDDVIIGKPRDKEDAVATLRKLSGRCHEVLTGMALAYGGNIVVRVAKTQVFFKKLTGQEIQDYVATGEPLDKAGSYGIQDGAGFMVDHIEGHYDNVVGLDVATVKEMLVELGLEEWG